MAGVAQVAEQRFRKPQVGGSIPLAGSSLFHLLSPNLILRDLQRQVPLILLRSIALAECTNHVTTLSDWLRRSRSTSRFPLFASKE